MGKKGDQLNNLAITTAAELLEKLSAIEGLSSKKMFGGVGIFSESKMFATVNSKGEIFFKVSDKNRDRYEKHDAHQMGKMPYFSVPDAVLDQQNELLNWARESITIAHD